MFSEAVTSPIHRKRDDVGEADGPHTYPWRMSWRNGKPVALLSDLAGFALAHQENEARQTNKVLDLDAVDWGRLSRAISAYQCELSNDTVRTRDCGLHGIIQNVQGLKLNSEIARQLVSFADEKGLEQASKFLRLKLLVWLQRNAETAVLCDDVTLGDWIRMSHHTLEAYYISHMREAGAWIDIAMLYAASALLGIQWMIFLPASRLQMLAAQLVQEKGRAAVGLLAKARHVFLGVSPYCLEPAAGQGNEDALLAACQKQHIGEDSDGASLCGSEEGDCKSQPLLPLPLHCFKCALPSCCVTLFKTSSAATT